jgi:hypothetical protein
MMLTIKEGEIINIIRFIQIQKILYLNTIYNQISIKINNNIFDH